MLSIQDSPDATPFSSSHPHADPAGVEVEMEGDPLAEQTKHVIDRVGSNCLGIGHQQPLISQLS
jgi:hypothetical protein